MSAVQQIESVIHQAPMPVRFDRAGEPRRLPPIVDRGAVRVVRAALDAAPCATEASVAIEFMPGAVAVQIDHDCRCERDLEDLEELAAARGIVLETAGLEALDALWNEAKREER